ncbi:TolB-like translocation protein [Sphingomonas hylomeconis]|uniref:Uncharacterized protein n=1 Tax=Sphingomonas hylomeconis TaxID=1395958 RepID=A0ABV7SXQ8_9SPHN|nr:hypothetical protein [Sphingomonas hylomeconis]
MSKIANLPEVAAPDGTETVVILKDGVAKRSLLSSLVSAALVPFVNLARNYANASTDAAIPGAVDPADRGAKYWSLSAWAARAGAEAAAASADWKNAIKPVGLEGKILWGISRADDDGLGERLALFVDIAGVMRPSAIALPAGSVTGASLDLDLSARTLQPIAPEGRILWAVEVPDADGLGSRMPLYVTDDGVAHAGNMAVSQADYLSNPALAISPNWIVGQKAMGDGTITLRSVSRNGGRVVDLVTGDKATSPVFTPDGAKVIYRSAASATYMVVSPDGTSTAPLRLTPRLTNMFWLGHSIVEQGLPAAFQTKTGIVSTNGGISGQRPEDIGYRFGQEFAITVTGNSIPGSGAVTLAQPASTAAVNRGPFANTAAARSMVVTVAGVRCILRGPVNAPYTIERETAGDAIAVAPGTLIAADLTGIADQMIYVRLMRNAMTDLAAIGVAVNAIKAAVAKHSYNPRIIWSGELPIAGPVGHAQAERLGSANRASYEAANAYLLSLVGPDSYYDPLPYMQSDACFAALGLTKDADDLADIAAGVAPRRFMNTSESQWLHESNLGRTADVNGIVAKYQRNWS